jgi:hypothetical protein
MVLPDALREKFPDVDVEAMMQKAPNAQFPVGGYSFHRPGELGPDTVHVFWVETPARFGTVVRRRGPFLFGLAATLQTTPVPVRAAVAGARRGQSVWYVHDDSMHVLATGTMDQPEPDYKLVSAAAAARLSSTMELSCSSGTSLPGRDGSLIRIYDIRAIPRQP